MCGVHFPRNRGISGFFKLQKLKSNWFEKTEVYYFRWVEVSEWWRQTWLDLAAVEVIKIVLCCGSLEVTRVFMFNWTRLITWPSPRAVGLRRAISHEPGKRELNIWWTPITPVTYFLKSVMRDKVLDSGKMRKWSWGLYVINCQELWRAASSVGESAIQAPLPKQCFNQLLPG